MELAITAKLWSFITESWPLVIKFERKIPCIKLVGDDSTHDTGGEFRTEGDAAVSFIKEGVHLFADDIAAFARSASKDFGVFHRWDDYFLITVELASRP